MTLIPTSSFGFGFCDFIYLYLLHFDNLDFILTFQIYLCFYRSLSLWYLLHFHSWKPILNLKVCSYSLRSVSLWYLLHFHSWKPIINLKVCSYSCRSLSLWYLLHFHSWKLIINLKVYCYSLRSKSELESKIDFCNFVSYCTNPFPCSSLTLATWSSILFFKLIIIGMRSSMKNCNSSSNFFNKDDILT